MQCCLSPSVPYLHDIKEANGVDVQRAVHTVNGLICQACPSELNTSEAKLGETLCVFVCVCVVCVCV